MYLVLIKVERMVESSSVTATVNREEDLRIKTKVAGHPFS